MEIRFEKTGEFVIVHLKGRMSYESVDPFHIACMEYLLNEKVIVNLAELSFVGSQGLSSFVKTMEELAAGNQRQIKFCAVASEFQKMFQNSEVRDIQILENAPQAQLAFQSVQVIPQSFMGEPSKV